MQSKAMVWVGRLMSALVVLVLLADALMNLLLTDDLRKIMAESQIPTTLAPALGAIMLSCAILYAIPRTAVIGAILTTGFLGGAILTHARLDGFISAQQLVCLLLGLLAWGGLWLRDLRVRALLPLAR
jgi:hypothetical protein